MKPPTAPSVKFLLVDDLEENLIALEALLRREGLQCLLARSGRAALELLLVNDVALVILDVQMPDMNGYEVAETMRQSARTRQIPIIFVTAGSGNLERIYRGYETGAVDFLVKPIDPRVLTNKAEIFFQLHRQKQQLRSMLDLQETFTGIVSHDLRNPLNVLLCGSELLAMHSDDMVVKTAGRMRTASARMTRIIDQLYDLTRSRIGGGIEVNPQRMDLAELCQSIVSEHEALKAHIELIISGDTVGVWDEVRLGQVVSNLLSNALKHSTSPITMRLSGQPDTITLSVWNDGAIAEEMRDTLFDPFRRSKLQREGLGLGLYIVKEIVQAHGGVISVETNEATGTLLSVELPRVTKKSAED